MGVEEEGWVHGKARGGPRGHSFASFTAPRPHNSLSLPTFTRQGAEAKIGSLHSFFLVGLMASLPIFATIYACTNKTFLTLSIGTSRLLMTIT